jgi:H+/Cl- antiporter ClcA
MFNRIYGHILFISNLNQIKSGEDLLFMSTDLNLRSREYWKRMGWGLSLGLLSAIGAFIFIFLMTLGQSLILPNLTNWTPFTGPWWIIGVMTGAGFIVGLIHRYTTAQQMDVFKAVKDGYLDPKPVPSSILISLISLITGFCLGPEVPTGMLSAGLGSWISKLRAMSSDQTKINVQSSISGAYAGLFSSPVVVLLMLLESDHKQTINYYGTLLIAGLAAVVGFGLFYTLNGMSVSSLLGILSPPAYHLRIYDLVDSIGLGILAVPFALLFVIMTKGFSRIVKPLNSTPILRGVLGGFLLGLLAFILPTTIGLGTTQMPVITQHAAEIGVLLLIVFALAKLVALSGALNFGFIGGPIFPLLFVGSSLGSAIHLIFPQVPLGLALGCMIVAVPAAIVPIPLALAAIGIVIIGLPANDLLPVFIAALVAFSITHGLGLGGSNKETPVKKV